MKPASKEERQARFARLLEALDDNDVTTAVMLEAEPWIRYGHTLLALLDAFDLRLVEGALGRVLEERFGVTDLRPLLQKGAARHPYIEDAFTLDPAYRLKRWGTLAAARDPRPADVPDLSSIDPFVGAVLAALDERRGSWDVVRLGLLAATEPVEAVTSLVSAYKEADRAVHLPLAAELLRAVDRVGRPTCKSLPGERGERFAIEEMQLVVATRILENHFAAREATIDAYYRTGRYFDRPRVAEDIAAFVEGGDRWILEIHAKGGMGKTMLLQWLLARHCVQVDALVPAARVDFDFLPRREEREPAAIVYAAATVLDAQIDSGGTSSLFGSLLASFASADKKGFPESFRAILGRTSGPILLVIDTTEVVVADQAYVMRLIDELAAIHDKVKGLRVIFSGRYPLREKVVAAQKYSDVWSTIELRPLDDEDARRFVRTCCHVTSEPLVEAIARRGREDPAVPGATPFRLMMLADIQATDGLSAEEVLGITKVDLEYLISRIVDRIEDEALRWVVRYGVIPRRLTLEILQKVMLPYVAAIATDETLDDPTAGLDQRLRARNAFKRAAADGALEAEHLWTELGRYVATASWLMADKAHPDAVVFHTEVVEPMRRLLDRQPVVEHLHADLADHFAARVTATTDLAARAVLQAELFYHRFHLGASEAEADYLEALTALSYGEAIGSVGVVAEVAFENNDLRGEPRRGPRKPWLSPRGVAKAKTCAALASLPIGATQQAADAERALAIAKTVETSLLDAEGATLFATLRNVLLESLGARDDVRALPETGAKTRPVEPNPSPPDRPKVITGTVNATWGSWEASGTVEVVSAAGELDARINGLLRYVAEPGSEQGARAGHRAAVRESYALALANAARVRPETLSTARDAALTSLLDNDDLEGALALIASAPDAGYDLHRAAAAARMGQASEAVDPSDELTFLFQVIAALARRDAETALGALAHVKSVIGLAPRTLTALAVASMPWPLNLATLRARALGLMLDMESFARVMSEAEASVGNDPGLRSQLASLRAEVFFYGLGDVRRAWSEVERARAMALLPPQRVVADLVAVDLLRARLQDEEARALLEDLLRDSIDAPPRERLAVLEGVPEDWRTQDQLDEQTRLWQEVTPQEYREVLRAQFRHDFAPGAIERLQTNEAYLKNIHTVLELERAAESAPRRGPLLEEALAMATTLDDRRTAKRLREKLDAFNALRSTSAFDQQQQPGPADPPPASPQKTVATLRPEGANGDAHAFVRSADYATIASALADGDLLARIGTEVALPPAFDAVVLDASASDVFDAFPWEVVPFEGRMLGEGRPFFRGRDGTPLGTPPSRFPSRVQILCDEPGRRRGEELAHFYLRSGVEAVVESLSQVETSPKREAHAVHLVARFMYEGRIPLLLEQRMTARAFLEHWRASAKRRWGASGDLPEESFFLVEAVTEANPIGDAMALLLRNAFAAQLCSLAPLPQILALGPSYEAVDPTALRPLVDLLLASRPLPDVVTALRDASSARPPLLGLANIALFADAPQATHDIARSSGKAPAPR